jgi:hypothetical protein
LRRKPSGGEWAWFLEEEREPRKKRIFLADENPRADESACLAVPSSRIRRCLIKLVNMDYSRDEVVEDARCSGSGLISM